MKWVRRALFATLVGLILRGWTTRRSFPNAWNSPDRRSEDVQRTVSGLAQPQRAVTWTVNGAPSWHR